MCSKKVNINLSVKAEMKDICLKFFLKMYIILTTYVLINAACFPMEMPDSIA